jgi:hypothetical protein
MTYGRVCVASHIFNAEGADVSHLAELARGDFSHSAQGPLIRPSGHLLPKGRRGTFAQLESD